MTTGFKIALGIFAITLYLVGYISWRVQEDALKRGYGSLSATFWALCVLFLTPLMLPLYIIFREKSKPAEKAPDILMEARKKLFITCPHCGEQNPPEMARCQKCDKSLTGEGKAVGTKSCPYCGEQNEINSIHCTNCKQSI